ncbi:CoA pyrophosphatase [Vibrio rumoiensis]|uniref:Coenzyme A pyrophosphatase n=1 Tax=Vibrio rumoiensis 1S-45 TaxID=1188252 RepID=A0A1E5E5Q4_9VIBR|nr:CoA pyrophosphatase [Vibrio rumoiensis]OEF29215.1 coenzyme A pyrophosphatase [Vibrio rumoiensis 1S-45]
MNKQDLLRQFSLNIPSYYQPESLNRVAHLKSESLRKAAVLIPCVDRKEGLSVIFTKRASHLKNHPGQISFPGGKYEELDPSLSHTALREAHEEIGLSPSQVQLIGQLPELTTISRFSVTPFMGIVDERYSSQIDKNEVDYIFEVPASYLFDPSNLFTKTLQVKGKQHQIFAINYQTHFIWGVTAQIIQALQVQLHHSIYQQHPS